MSLPEVNEPFDPNRLELPAPPLLTYYILGTLFSGPFLVLLLPPLWIRYKTLKYQFEDGALRMQVGFLFRKETVTAYRRIQDIHVTSNVIQRWLGIASISIQTASGSAMPEIVLEGVTQPEKMRDWLYERLRGAKGGSAPGNSPGSISGHAPSTANTLQSDQASDEVVELLSEIRDNLATLARRSHRGDA